MALPSRKELPDYYEVIERPMDFNRIRKKIREGRYQAIDDIGEDVGLLSENAQRYNEDGSDIFNDSVILKKVWDFAKDKFKAEINEVRLSPCPQIVRVCNCCALGRPGREERISAASRRGSELAAGGRRESVEFLDHSRSDGR